MSDGGATHTPAAATALIEPAAMEPGVIEPGVIETDAVIVGAGPVGLFQVFELGLLEIRAHVIDSLPQVGGQCTALYPDKPIYDIPALPAVSGQGLIDNLMAQIAPFGATLHLDQQVRALARQSDGRFRLETDRGSVFVARTVFIAAGAGAFAPRQLQLPGLARFNDRQVFHHVADAARFEGRRVVIAGGGDSAIDWANALVGRVAELTLVHRRDSFRAAPASVARMREHVAAGRMTLEIGQVSAYAAEAADTTAGAATARAAGAAGADAVAAGTATEAASRLTSLTITRIDGSTRTVPVDDLLVLYGLAPSLGPIADWSLALERRLLTVDTEKFETSEPGIFAVGDINTYPGKKKLILSGFHEAALAAFGAAAYVFPAKRIHLQYTTTSTRLHAVLGVETPDLDREA